VGRDDRSAIVARAVGPERPLQLGGGEPGGANLDDDVADGGHRIGCFLVDEPVNAFEAGGLVDSGCLHRNVSIALLLCHIGGLAPVTAMTRRDEGM
jgi:hypothetical protein